MNRDKFFNISHDLFCILDRKGYYKEINPSFLKLLGHKREEVMESLFYSFLHPEDVAPTKKEYEAVINGKHNKVVNNRFRDKQGYYHWISWSSIVFDTNGFFYAAGQNITEKKNLQEALNRQIIDSQRKVTAAIIHTQEKVRTQVGRELHDNVNQVLTTVKLLLELCLDNKVDVPETLKKVIRLQQDAIGEIRNLSKRLSAPSLGSIKLKESVEDLMSPLSETTPLHIRLNASGIDGLDVPHDIHLAVYRILQEHFTNILKHASATSVIITLDCTGGMLLLKVTDDGVGFDAGLKYGGIGLTNMKTRAESMHGNFEMSSGPGNGCTLTVLIPLDGAY